MVELILIHQKSLLKLTSSEYRQDHNLFFLYDTFISKDVIQNSESFKFFVESNFNEFLWEKIRNSKKYIFFNSVSAICEGEDFTFKRKQDIIGATSCVCRSQ